MIGTTVSVLMSWLMIHSDSLPCLILFCLDLPRVEAFICAAICSSVCLVEPNASRRKLEADDTFSLKQSNLYAFVCVVYNDPAHCDARRNGLNKFLDANLNTNVKISIFRIVQWMPDEMQLSASWSSSVFVLYQSSVNVFRFWTSNKQFGDVTVSFGTFCWPFSPLFWRLVINLMCENQWFIAEYAIWWFEIGINLEGVHSLLFSRSHPFASPLYFCFLNLTSLTSKSAPRWLSWLDVALPRATSWK